MDILWNCDDLRFRNPALVLSSGFVKDAGFTPCGALVVHCDHILPCSDYLLAPERVES